MGLFSWLAITVALASVFLLAPFIASGLSKAIPSDYDYQRRLFALPSFIDSERRRYGYYFWTVRGFTVFAALLSLTQLVHAARSTTH